VATGLGACWTVTSLSTDCLSHPSRSSETQLHPAPIARGCVRRAASRQLVPLSEGKMRGEQAEPSLSGQRWGFTGERQDSVPHSLVWGLG
jgi:hypothetical protein